MLSLNVEIFIMVCVVLSKGMFSDNFKKKTFLQMTAQHHSVALDDVTIVQSKMYCAVLCVQLPGCDGFWFNPKHHGCNPRKFVSGQPTVTESNVSSSTLMYAVKAEQLYIHNGRNNITSGQDVEVNSRAKTSRSKSNMKKKDQNKREKPRTKLSHTQSDLKHQDRNHITSGQDIGKKQHTEISGNISNVKQKDPKSIASKRDVNDKRRSKDKTNKSHRDETQVNERRSLHPRRYNRSGRNRHGFSWEGKVRTNSRPRRNKMSDFSRTSRNTRQGYSHSTSTYYRNRGSSKNSQKSSHGMSSRKSRNNVSQWKSARFGHGETSSLPVDGDITTCDSSTNKENPSFTIYLGAERRISKIVIHSRSPFCGDSDGAVKLCHDVKRRGQDVCAGLTCGVHSPYSDKSKSVTFTCPSPSRDQMVELSCKRGSTLEVCEVEVFDV